MVDIGQSGKPIDFSIMPSFRCNLNCWFCMYDAGPDNCTELDFGKTKKFLSEFDWGLINSFGFYGGEPSISTKLYDKFIALIPAGIPKFVITNGSWSLNYQHAVEFLHWCAGNHFHVFVSSTDEHIKHQNRELLEKLINISEGIELKKPDEIHAQGRAKGKQGVVSDCRFSCQRTDRNIRLGLKPCGDIVYQNCHGEYHIVQTYEDSFKNIAQRAELMRDKCFASKAGGEKFVNRD